VRLLKKLFRDIGLPYRFFGRGFMFFTNLETERLFLKNIDTSDRDFVFSMFSDDVVTKYLFDEEPLIDISGADEIINSYLEPEPRTHHRWIIIRKSDNTKMGTCGFHCWNRPKKIVEVGYDLKEQFWGNGYMQEAVREIIAFAKDKMDIEEICANIYIENQKSKKLAESLGFVVSGYTSEFFRNQEYKHYKYSLYLRK
jgi:ribosomal-protein-alanine N-acetyltransferase